VLAHSSGNSRFFACVSTSEDLVMATAIVI
jgi:hypothetical protein